MLRGAGPSIRHVHLPLELITATCTVPSSLRFLSIAAKPTRKSLPASGQRERGHSRGRVSGNGKPYIPKDKVPPKRTSVLGPSTLAGERPKRLLEPHVLSQRLKALCDDGQLDAAVDMLKSSPKDAQSTPVWNTLIWEALKAQRWNLSYKLYTDVSTRTCETNDRTFTPFNR